MPCTTPGCDRPATRRELCTAHYNRWIRHGTPGPSDIRPRRVSTYDGFDLASIAWQDWRDDANCARLAHRDYDPWFPEPNSRAEAVALDVCQQCPVRNECLADALEQNETHGIRGGLTPGQRRQLRRRAAA